MGWNMELWKPILEAAGYLAAVLAGGTVTVGGAKLNMPGLKWLKRLLISDEDVSARLTNYRSYHPVTVVLAVKKNGQLTDATIRAASGSAEEFYGFATASNALQGKRTQELFTTLARYMTADDYKAFVTDQERLLADYREGLEAYAKVPIRFNEEHPMDKFKNKCFVPIIVGLSGEHDVNGGKAEDLTVLYLNAEKVLPPLRNGARPMALAGAAA